MGLARSAALADCRPISRTRDEPSPAAAEFAEKSIPFRGAFAHSPLPSTPGCAWMVAGLGGHLMRNLGIVALCAALGGCVTAETVSFRASNPQQQAMMRDGQPALVSRLK